MHQISPKQKEILAFIKEHFAEKSISPTLREIGDAVEIDSRSGVLHHIKVLEDLNFLRREKSQRSRCIFPVETPTFSRIPILGVANAGQPLAEADEDRMGTLQVDTSILKNDGNLFAVKIKGDSMNLQTVPRSGSAVRLENNNFAIVDRESNWGDKDIVLAVINGGATIKMIRITDNSVVLVPNSTDESYQPIYVQDPEDLFINGRVVRALENVSLP